MFLVKIPGINSKENNKGCRNSGNAVIEELRRIKMNENGRIIDVDFLDLEEIHVDNLNLKESEKLIYENSVETFETKPKTFFLGGDHSITFSAGKAFMEHCINSKKDFCLIVFDSEADCSEEKSQYATNENWLFKLVEHGFPSENILLVGARNMSLEKLTFLKKNQIKNITMNQFKDDFEETTDIVMEFSDKKDVYISIDIGVIDSVFVPSATHKNPGGFTSREFLYIISRLNKIKRLAAIDLVEINKDEDSKIGNVTIKLGAKIVSEFL